ncbi:D-alanyl-D-alanine carboxypeptidase family protein [Bradyrhizobium sp. BR 10261]|uniref:D-alanyl-D-alanine carboxypeptidase family protein n=1 Tax=Bradyrhizobium sp. BR 10261 TaxID=2749992 RepID=UPI001C64C255|nr:D-alanyl-D-alanine carboxypeptidase family protein [Bradyrhizobium sp. BR 10261]
MALGLAVAAFLSAVPATAAHRSHHRGGLPVDAGVRYSSIVVDWKSGQVLQEDDPDRITYPASLTKMMTLYLTFDALEKGTLTLQQLLPVSERAESMVPTKLGVRMGQHLRVEDAILALITRSANDAAVVLAEAQGGTEDAFAEAMTRKAKELGMKNSIFRNASGLPDPEQRSTARDLAILAGALIADHPEFYPYFSRRAFNWRGSTIATHNHLMERYPGMDGLKTGYVRAAGFNLAASAKQDGRRLVGIVLGGRSPVARDDHMAILLDSAFAE